MNSTKRPYSQIDMETPNHAVQSSQSIISIFENFRDELDEHQERRERIIKASRDITALSKKIIFALQRAPKLGVPLPSTTTKTTTPFYTQIQTLFTSISPDLKSTNGYRYQRQISSGLQEYIEAISFHHYLETQTLITHAAAQAQIPGGVLLSEDDYLLGLFDMTGELMRYAITGIATGGDLQGSESTEGKRDILADMRALRSGMESLDLQNSGMRRDVEKKMEVMRQSVEKVERAAYGLVVRGSERPKGWVPELGGGGGGGEDRREVVESY